LKKRTKKFLRIGFGLAWKSEAEIIKSFLLLFFKKEVLSCLSVCLAPWYRPHPSPPPERGREKLGSYLFFKKEGLPTASAYPERTLT
jgi:hypothetical protein